MLRYFSRIIKGSNNYWCSCPDDLEQWINHHVGRRHAPPTVFISLSFAKNWWPDLRCLIYELESIRGNYQKAQAIKEGSRKEMSNAVRKYSLFITDFFMKHVNLFMKTVMKNALQIEHYWGHVEFAPGRGAIHLHVMAIATNRAYLQDLFKASTLQEKAKVLKNYATKHLNMIADAKVSNNLNYPPDYSTSPLARTYSECSDKEEDV
jgi:hypothetical protein